MKSRLFISLKYHILPMNNSASCQMEDARAKLAKRFSNTRTGGRGSVRRKKKSKRPTRVQKSTENNATAVTSPPIPPEDPSSNSVAATVEDHSVTVEDIDETGVNAKDIEVVQQQTNAPRVKVVNALKENNGNIVDAIMDLSI